MPIRITGIDRVIKANGKATKKIKRLVDDALVKCAEVLLAESQKLVPVDTEALKKSGKVVKNDKKGLAASATVEYGGPEAPYAFIVHERLEIYHAPPTQARYLADAIHKVRGVMTNIIKRRLSILYSGKFG